MSEETKDSKTDTPPAGLTPVWRRIMDHRVVQWTVGYVAIAYGIQHGVTLTSEAFEWPIIVARVSMLLLILGLPLVMALAWYHGERTSRRISGGELAIIAVLLVIGSFLFYVFIRPAEQIAARSTAAVQSVAAAPTPAKLAGNSVAVLPFLNLSGDPKEEYFSDGMTEEITSALSNVKGVDVVARTSAFAFKGRNEDVVAIGHALRATHIIEGSVRREGNQVRITAQLIRADTGGHLWTDSYDRELKDVFAVQEDIARAIAAALQVPLGLKQGENLVSNRDIDPDSYRDYLRADAMVRSRGLGNSLSAPIALLRQVVARQPNYAPAWALLAHAYAIEPLFNPIYLKGSAEELRNLVNESQPLAEAAARRAIQLDPRNAYAYAMLGSVQSNTGRLLDAEQSYKKALSLDPLHPQALQEYSTWLSGNGAIKQAVVVREQLRAVEPLLPAFNTPYARLLSLAGDNVRALAVAEGEPSDYHPRATLIAWIYSQMGRYKEAADALLKAHPELHAPGVIEAAKRLLRMAPSPAKGENVPDLAGLDWVFAYVGLPERALEFEERVTDTGYRGSGFDEVWSPGYAAARRTERFKALVRKRGMVDYWRARGWPEFCHPVGADDFACH
jgi:TolB-like protein